LCCLLDILAKAEGNKPLTSRIPWEIRTRELIGGFRNLNMRLSHHAPKGRTTSGNGIRTDNSEPGPFIEGNSLLLEYLKIARYAIHLCPREHRFKQGSSKPLPLLGGIYPECKKVPVERRSDPPADLLKVGHKRHRAAGSTNPEVKRHSEKPGPERPPWR
jgi:hypothetical protein